MAENYGIKLGVKFDFEEAKQNLSKVINDIQNDYKVDLKFNNINFDKILNEYKNLQKKLQNNAIKINAVGGLGNVYQDLDKIKQAKQQVNDIARRLSYQEEQERLRVTTDTQKKIEQLITGSNETIAQKEVRLNKVNGQQYEQLWIKVLKEKEQKAIEIENRIAQTEQKRIQKLGSPKGSISSNMFGDSSYIKAQVQAIYGADASIKSYKSSLDSAGNSQIKMTIATQKSKNEIREYGVTIDKATQKVYQNSEAIKINNKHISNAFERMGNSIKQAVIMASTIGLMYKGFEKVHEAIQTVTSLDREMVQVREITQMTQEQTDKLTKSYSKMSLDLSTTLTDMSKLTVELTRQGLAIDETTKRMQIFSKFNKVSNGEIGQSTELMTAGINSMQVDAQELSDVLIKVGAVSGTSAQEVGAIIQKAGAMAKEGKVSLQELATMGAIISEKTRESGETVGTSLKTIFAKFQQVKKDTGEINKDFGNTINTIEQAGIKTGALQGQLKPVGEILRDLASKWNDMSDKQKAMVSSSLGVYQLSRFSALMQGLAKNVDGVSRSQQIYGEVMNANGETNKQYEAYLNSLTGSIDKFKAQWEVLFNNAMNSTTLKNIVDIGTGLISIADKIGGLRVALAGLSTVLLLSNKRFKAWIGEFKKVGDITKMLTILKAFPSVLRASIIEMGVMRGSLHALKVSFDLANIGAKILQATLTMGLSLAISFAIEGIMKLINKSAELKKKNEELQQSVQQNLKSNNDMIKYLQNEGKEYDTLSKKTKLTVQEQEKLKSIKQQLVDKFPELVKGINSETGEMELQKKSTKDLIELLKEKNKLENYKLIDSGKDVLKNKQQEYIKKQEEIQNLQREAEKIKSGGNNVGKGSYAYKHTIDGLEEMKRTVGLTAEQQDELNRKTEDYKNTLAKVSVKFAEQKQLTSELKPYVDAIYDTKGLDEFEKKLALIKIDPSKVIKNGKLDFSDLQVEIQQLKDSIENNPSYSTIKMVAKLDNPKDTDLKKYFDAIVTTSKTLKMSPLELTKIMPLKVDKEYLSKNAKLIVSILQQEMKKATGQNKIDLSNMIKLFDGSKVAKENNAVASSISNIATQQKNLDEIYQGSINNAKDYNKYLKELSENGHLSAESIGEIMKRHENLLPVLNDEKQMKKALENADKQERDVALNAIRAKLEGNVAFCSQVIRDHQTAFNNIKNAYQVDLTNFQTVATAKSKIDVLLCESIKKNWIKTYGSMGEGIGALKEATRKSFLEYKTGATDGSKFYEMKETYKQVEGLNKGISIMEDAINKAKDKIANTSLSPVNFKGIGAGSSKGRKAKKGKSHKDSPIIYNGKELDNYEAKIKDINSRLEDYDKNISTISQKISNLKSIESKSNYADVIDMENKKISEQRKKLHELELDKQRSSRYKSEITKVIRGKFKFMKSYDLDKLTEEGWNNIYNSKFGKNINFGTGDVAKKRQEAYEKEAREFEQLRKNHENMSKLVEKLGQDRLKIEEEINSTIKERIEVQKSSYEQQVKSQQQSLNKAQLQLDLFNTHEKDDNNVDYIKKAQLTSELINQQNSSLVTMVGIRNEINRQMSGLQKNSLEWNLLNQLLDEYNNKINESHKTLESTKETLEEIRKVQLKDLSDIQDKIVEALRKKHEEELKLAKEKKAKELLIAKNLKDEQLKLIKDGSKTALEIFEDEHNKKIELLNEELKSYEEIYNAKIREIDDKESEDKYQQDLNKKQQDKSKLQSQHDELLMDSSLEAKAKRESLLEEIKKKQEDIDKFQHDRDITLRKQNLKDTLEAQKKKLKSKVDSENKEYKEAKKRYSKEVKALEEANKEKIKKENLYAEARELLMKNNFNNLNELLVKYGSDSDKIFGIMGKTIKQQICDNLKEAIDLMQNFNTLSDKNKWQKAIGYESKNIIGNAEKPKEITRFGNSNKGIYEWDNVYESKEYQDLQRKFLDAKMTNNEVAQNEARKGIEQLLNKHKKYKTGGLNVSTGFHWLDGTNDKPELVLNAEQTQAMIDMKDYFPSIAQAIKHISNLPHANINTEKIKNVSQPIELKVDNLINVEGNLDKGVVPQVKDAGNDVLMKIKQEMNKKGFYRRL